MVAHRVLALLLLAPCVAQSQTGQCGADADAPAPLAHGLYVLDAVTYTESDLPPGSQQALFDARVEFYKKQLAIINGAVLEAAFEREAQASGSTRDAVEDALYAVPTPDDAAIEAYYQEHRARIPYPLESVRDQIVKALNELEVARRQAKTVARTKSKRGFKLLLEPPIAPVADIDIVGQPSRGPDIATVTIVEFADYQCPHCKRAAQAFHRLLARYPQDVRLVIMDLPVHPSGISTVIAHGAVCAREQDAYWQYHDLAFERQQSLTHASPAELAVALGLDRRRFDDCMATDAPREQVQRSKHQAGQLGLRRTPAIFVNGRRMHLHDIEAELVPVIDELLAKRER